MRARMFVIATALAGAVLYLDRCATRAELAELRAAVPRLRAEPPRTEVVWRSPPGQAMARAPATEPASPPVEAARSAPHEPAPPKRAETPIEQFAPVHDALEAVFVSESRDGAWGMQASRTADNALAGGLAPGSTVRPAECRSTLCRIESTHDGYASARRFVGRLAAPEGRPWNGAFYAGPISQESGTGAVTVIMYLAREGAEMPTIPDRGGDDPAVH
jgi:hypothetical protein